MNVRAGAVSEGAPALVERRQQVRDRVEQALKLLRPYLQADGGDVELVEVKEPEGIVRVKLLGACGGCPMATMTLKGGIERALKEQLPEVKAVEAV